MDLSLVKVALEQQLTTFYPECARSHCTITPKPFDYHRGSSVIVPFTLSWPSTQKTVFVKIPKKPDDFEREIQGICRAQLIFENESDLRVPKFLGIIPSLQAYAVEEAVGSLLLEQITTKNTYFANKDESRTIETSLKQAALWLNRYHQALGQMQDFDSDNYLEIFDQHLERLRPFRPAADILQSLEQFRPFVSRLEGLSSLYSQCHNDYGPGNILVDGTTITVLDIPWGFYDSIYHDLSYFVMQLETLNFSWKQPLFNQANIRRWTDLFIHTYFHEKPVNQLLLELHLLRNLIRRADNVYAKLSHSSSLRQSLKALRFDPYFRSQINGAIKTIQMLYQTNQQG